MTKILFCAILFLATLLCSQGMAAEFVLVVNNDNPVAGISRQDAKNIFLGKKSTWPDGRSIVFFIQENDALTDAFVRDTVNKSAQQFSTYWKKALFTGTGTPPQVLDGDSAMKSVIAGNRDAIGYITPSQVDATVKPIDIR